MNYKVGDRVQIVSERTNSMNWDGKMDKWLGKIMTIRLADKNHILPYKMLEDCFEHNGNGWFWDDSMIAEIR